MESLILVSSTSVFTSVSTILEKVVEFPIIADARVLYSKGDAWGWCCGVGRLNTLNSATPGSTGNPLQAHVLVTSLH